MTVRVLLFGHYREAIPTGDGALDVEVPEGATVADLAGTLAARSLRLSDLLSRTRAAVRLEFAHPTTRLHDGDEVAFLPPMSGG